MSDTNDAGKLNASGLNRTKSIKSGLARALNFASNLNTLDKLRDTIRDILVFISYFVAPTAGAIYVYLAIAYEEVGYIASHRYTSIALAISFALSLSFILAQSRRLGRLSRESEALTISNAKLSAVVPGLESSVRDLRTELQMLHAANTELTTYQSRNKTVVQYLYSMTKDNSDCDESLFSSFNRIVESKKGKRANLLEAHRLVVGNIDAIINHAHEIFSAYTGHSCAVCIKTLDRDPETGDPVIRALKRDIIGSANRGRYDNDPKQVYKARDNTAFREILFNRHHYYRCDDLIAAADKGEYDNPRKYWRTDHTATFVHAIRFVNPRTKNDLLHFLCVDNMGGDGFETDEALKYMQKICSRLSVMSYRSVVLESMLQINTTWGRP
jgi:hypothetical protein